MTAVLALTPACRGAWGLFDRAAAAKEKGGRR
jgi:hypothetical protein